MNDYDEQVCHVERVPIGQLESLMSILWNRTDQEYSYRSSMINFTALDTDSHIPLLITLLDERSGSNPAANNLYLIAGIDYTQGINQVNYIKQKVHFAGLQKIESITIHNSKEAICLENVLRDLTPGNSCVMAGRIVPVPSHWAQKYEG